LRHGIWEAPPTAILPNPQAFFGKGAGAARRAVQQASAYGGVAHVALDIAGLAIRDPRLQAVENVLRYTARRCGRGTARAATLLDLAKIWVRPRATCGARSILRAA
jgi:hypothetical protein